MSDCRRKPINEQREKLIELICTVNCEGGEDFLSCPERRNGHCRSIHKLEMCQLGAIADHLLANGVIVPPCKVGETLYFLYDNTFANRPNLTPFVYETNDWYFDIDTKGISILPRSIHSYKGKHHYYLGETVFLSREDAEKALKINTPTDTPTVNTID